MRTLRRCLSSQPTRTNGDVRNHREDRRRRRLFWRRWPGRPGPERAAEEPETVEREFEISDAAVATSGDYMQYFQHGGRRYHHLLDPTRAAPRQSSTHSVTVIAESCLTADAAATALFGLPRPPAAALLEVQAPTAQLL